MEFPLVRKTESLGHGLAIQEREIVHEPNLGYHAGLFKKAFQRGRSER